MPRDARILAALLTALLPGGVVVGAAEPDRRTDLTPRRTDLAPVRETKVEKMSTFNVRQSVFPSIDVHFELAGENLGDPLGDPILEANITSVDDDGLGDRLGLRVGDKLIRLNGTSIRGLTLRQLAALVAAARANDESLIWEGRRGVSGFSVKFNGKWDTPLPGLHR